MGTTPLLAALAGVLALAPLGCFLVTDLDALSAGKGGETATSASSTSGDGGATTSSAASQGGAGGVMASSSGSGGAGGAGGDGGEGGAGGIAHDPVWWNQAWPRRAPLAITLAPGEALVNGAQVAWSGDLAAMFGAGTTLESVRAARWSDGKWSPVPTHVEMAGGAPWVWLLLEPATVAAPDPAAGYWLYAGHPSPPPPDPPAKVFPDLWHPFTTLTGFGQQGTPVINNGAVVLAPGSAVRTLVTFGPGHAVDMRMRATVDVTTTADNAWTGGGFQRASDFNVTEPWLLWISRAADEVHPEAAILAAGANYLAGGKKPLVLGETHLYSVERLPTSARYFLDNTFVDQLTWLSSYTSPLQVRLMAHSSGTFEIELVRVRRTVEPSPQLALGPVESLR